MKDSSAAVLFDTYGKPQADDTLTLVDIITVLPESWVAVILTF